MNRIENLRSIMNELDMEAVLIANPVNRYYLSGFTGSAGLVLITQQESIFLTDFRYKDQAVEQCSGFKVEVYNAERSLNDILKMADYKSLGYENEFITAQSFEDLKTVLSQTKLVPLNKTLETIRQVKSDIEVSKVAKASEITDRAFEYILGVIKQE